MIIPYPRHREYPIADALAVSRVARIPHDHLGTSCSTAKYKKISRLIVFPELQYTHLNICTTLDIRLGEHTEDAHENTTHALHGRPPLRGGFVLQRVVSGRVEDGDADFAGWVDCDGINQKAAERR